MKATFHRKGTAGNCNEILLYGGPLFAQQAATISISVKDHHFERPGTLSSMAPGLTRRKIFLSNKSYATEGMSLAFALQTLRRGSEPGAKRCPICGVSRPGTLLRASIVRPAALALIWLVLLIVA